MNRLKLLFSFISFVIIGIFVAAGMRVFDQSTPDSSTSKILVDLLFPGFIAGFVLGQRGEYILIGYFSCWFVNSVLYWLLWELLSYLIRKAIARPTR